MSNERRFMSGEGSRRTLADTLARPWWLLLSAWPALAQSGSSTYIDAGAVYPDQLPRSIPRGSTGR